MQFLCFFLIAGLIIIFLFSSLWRIIWQLSHLPILDPLTLDFRKYTTIGATQDDVVYLWKVFPDHGVRIFQIRFNIRTIGKSLVRQTDDDMLELVFAGKQSGKQSIEKLYLARVGTDEYLVLTASKDQDWLQANSRPNYPLQVNMATEPFSLGRQLVCMGLPEVGERVLRGVLELESTPSIAHLWLAAALYDQGFYREAEDIFRRIARKSPFFSDSIFPVPRSGSKKSEQQGYQKAKTQIKEAVVMFEQAQPQKSIQSFRAAIENAPDKVITNRSLGLALARRGEINESYEVLSLAAKLSRDPIVKIEQTLVDIARTRSRFSGILEKNISAKSNHQMSPDFPPNRQWRGRLILIVSFILGWLLAYFIGDDSFRILYGVTFVLLLRFPDSFLGALAIGHSWALASVLFSIFGNSFYAGVQQKVLIIEASFLFLTTLLLLYVSFVDRSGSKILHVLYRLLGSEARNWRDWMRPSRWQGAIHSLVFIIALRVFENILINSNWIREESFDLFDIALVSGVVWAIINRNRRPFIGIYHAYQRFFNSPDVVTQTRTRLYLVGGLIIIGALAGLGKLSYAQMIGYTYDLWEITIVFFGLIAGIMLVIQPHTNWRWPRTLASLYFLVQLSTLRIQYAILKVELVEMFANLFTVLVVFRVWSSSQFRLKRIRLEVKHRKSRQSDRYRVLGGTIGGMIAGSLLGLFATLLQSRSFLEGVFQGIVFTDMDDIASGTIIGLLSGQAGNYIWLTILVIWELLVFGSIGLGVGVGLTYGNRFSRLGKWGVPLLGGVVAGLSETLCLILYPQIFRLIGVSIDLTAIWVLMLWQAVKSAILVAAIGFGWQLRGWRGAVIGSSILAAVFGALQLNNIFNVTGLELIFDHFLAALGGGTSHIFATWLILTGVHLGED